MPILLLVLLFLHAPADAGFRAVGTGEPIDLSNRKAADQPILRVQKQEGIKAKTSAHQDTSVQKNRRVAAEQDSSEATAPRTRESNLNRLHKGRIERLSDWKPNKVHIPTYNLKKQSRKQIYTFMEKAKAMPEASREYKTKRGQNLVSRYKMLLQPVKPAPQIHTKLDLQLVKVNPLKEIPKDEWFEYQIFRLTHLFAFINHGYHVALPQIWHASHIKTAPQNFRARDAMITGAIARERGWEALATTAYHRAIKLGISKNADDFKRFLLDVRLLKNKDLLNFILASTSPNDWVAIKPITELNETFFHKAKTLIQTNTTIAEKIAEKIETESAASKKLDLLLSLHYAQKDAPEQAIQKLIPLTNKTDEEIRNNAHLTLARIFTMKRDHQQALEHYKKVTLNRQNKLDVMLERAFSEFNLGRYNDSLGKTIGLHSEFFRYSFSPESYLLEAYNRQKLCDFGGAENALLNLDAEYTKEKKLLRKLAVAKKASKESFFLYNALLDSFKTANRTRVHSYLLALPSVNKAQRVIYGLFAEIDTLKNIYHFKKYPNKYWNQMVKTHEQFYLNQKQRLIPPIEKEIQREIAYLNGKLNAIVNQKELLLVDIATAASSEHSVQNALNFDINGLSADEEERNLEKFQMRWPYEREIWEDELAYLSVSTPSRCINKQKIIKTTRLDN